MARRTGAPQPAPAPSPGAPQDRARSASLAPPRRGGTGAELRLVVVAASLAAVAALGVVTGVVAGTPARTPVIAAAVVLLAGAAGVGLLAVWRLYARPAARSARMLAAVAGNGGQPGASPESVAAVVQARMRHLEDANQRLSAVISGLPQGVLVFGRDGTLLELNHTGAGMLGIAAAAGTAANRAQLAMAARVLREHGVAQVTEPALYHGERAEADLRIPGREPRWLQAQSQPFTSAGGERGALVVLRDVTRLRRLEQVRSDFVANVSHELRTPITSISGFVETLLDNEMCNSAEARHFLRIIHRQSLRLGAIIDDLLSLADIELGEERRSIAFADTALAPVIASAILACEQAATARDVDLQARCDPDLTCRMNAQLVEQAVTNLLDNAINYSSRDAKVVVRARRSDSGVLIAVTDLGSGIAPEHQERIFERFYRVDRARSHDYGGTGLGLAIVKHIAQAHDGDVSVRSTAGRGSTFTLRLPG